jgi:glyoxylase-like metal-dependent hydrolase (beta-lactamase superfamily II)
VLQLNASRVARLVVPGALVLMAGLAQALTVDFQRVAEGVYAHVGDTGARSADNEGLNANIGLVVTPAGAVLIDSGATAQSARQIRDAAAKISMQPIRWVINTGDQDHRWLGNGFFAAQGAQIIAHADARADMVDRGNDELQSLRAEVGAVVDGTVPTLPTHWLKGNDERLELGGVVFEFKHRGGAHTPGDTMVWLPQKNVLFAGDVVFVDRMLGVLPVSNSRHWLDTFAVIEQLNPQALVPGHGSVTTVAKAKADTQAYLLALRAQLKRAVDDGTDIGAAVSAAVKSFGATPFMRLRNAAELMPGNASRTYLEIERE